MLHSQYPIIKLAPRAHTPRRPCIYALMIRELFGCSKHLILLINYNCINKLKTKSCFNATSKELLVNSFLISSDLLILSAASKWHAQIHLKWNGAWVLATRKESVKTAHDCKIETCRSISIGWMRQWPAAGRMQHLEICVRGIRPFKIESRYNVEAIADSLFLFNEKKRTQFDCIRVD